MSDVQDAGVVASEATEAGAVPVVKKMTLAVAGPDSEGAYSFTCAFGHGAVHSFTLRADDPQFVAFAVHGVKQKLSDMGSTKKTSELAEEGVAALIEQFEQGEWSVKGERGGETGPTGGLLAKALAGLYGKELSEVQAYLLSLHEDEKERAKIHNALRADPAVAAEIERIRPPRKEKKVNESAAQRAAAALAGLAG